MPDPDQDAAKALYDKKEATSKHRMCGKRNHTDLHTGLEGNTQKRQLAAQIKWISTADIMLY